MASPHECLCREGVPFEAERMGEIDGRMRLVKLGMRRPPLKHDCEYIKSREALFAYATPIANARALENAHSRKSPDWGREFSQTMDKLTLNHIHRLEPLPKLTDLGEMARFTAKYTNAKH